MAETFELEVVTPERQLVKEQVEEAQIPGKEGYLGVLPGHAPLLTELGTGFMYYVVGGRRRYLSIHGGFAEVLPDRARLLANASERAEEVDVDRGSRALDPWQPELLDASSAEDR